VREADGVLAIVVSVLVAVAGLWLALGHDGPTAIVTFGWVLVVLGALFLLANLELRRRSR
jgi:hypothetical protein